MKAIKASELWTYRGTRTGREFAPWRI